MRKTILFLILAVFGLSTGFAQKSVKANLQAKENKLRVKLNDRSSFTIEASLADLTFKSESHKKGNFVTLTNNLLIKTFNEGMPDIPVLSKLIEVPQGATVSFEVKSYKEEIVKLSDLGIKDKIMPARRSQSKSEDEVPLLMKESVYKTDDYTNKKVAIYQESGQMRAVRLGRIEVRPIQYNPVKNTLRILNDLVIEVKFSNANYTKTDALKAKYSSAFENGILSGQVINFDKNANKALLDATIHMVIVADRMFEAQLAPYIAWKVKKGFKVTVGYTDDSAVGTTTTSIKAYLQAIYEGTDPMDFVLFVGDVQQIPAWNGTSGSHVTDLRYCEYTGDNIPEVFYGRFSAQTTAQLQPQIDKTLMYEQYTMADPSYLADQVLIAGVDGNNAPVFGNGAINYISENYANSANGINPLTYLYDDAANSTVMSSDNSGASASITSYMSQGVGWANYTAHGSPDGWYNPGFEISEVESLQNDQKYGLWIGNCCLSVKFDESECFGEAALRKANGGAIGDIGGSNSTYWDEDYWWATGVGTCVESPLYENFGLGSYDAVYHTKANEVNDHSKWFITQGQVNTVGQLAVESSSSTRKTYYWEIYHLMGDPSIVNYLGVPTAMTVAPSPAALMLGMTALSVTSAPNSYVALSQNGVLIATARSNDAGTANLSFASDALAVGTADLVVTCQNKQPYIGTIDVSPADEPYIVLNSYTTSAAPNYGTSINLNATLENVATSGSGNNADNITATISTTDTYVTITDDTETYGLINAGDTKLINNAFAITIADNVPDQHVVAFDMVITGVDAKYTWNATLNLTVNAPEITINNFSITNDDNADGTLDPGETGDLNFNVTNSGHADAVFGGTLSEASDPNNYLTLGTTSVSGVSIAAGANSDFSFTGATADAATPLGSPVSVKLDVADAGTGNYTGTKTDEFNIGIIPIYPISNEGTLTVCTGTFYDSGLGTGEYSSSEDYTMTFLVPTGKDAVVVNFSEFELESNSTCSYDYLSIYDGPDASSPLIGTYCGTDSPGMVSGSNGLTFVFHSDGSVTKAGWVADVSCYSATALPDCVTNPIPANNATNVFPASLKWSAGAGVTSYDVYFGTAADPYTNTPTTVTTNSMSITATPDTDYYWAVLPTNSIGTASNCDVLTFKTGAAQYIMDDGQTVTTCSGVFYDQGGADGQYANSLDQTMTFMPGEAGKMMNIEFVEFATEGGYDYLSVYDATDASNLIGLYDEDDMPPTNITASNVDGALTFVFHSDGSLVRSGWVANMTCVTPSGVESITKEISIYPNPNSGTFSINLMSLKGEDVKVEITSITGRTVYFEETSKEMLNVDLHNQAQGIYFVKVSSGGVNFTGKIMIK